MLAIFVFVSLSQIYLTPPYKKTPTSLYSHLTAWTFRGVRKNFSILRFDEEICTHLANVDPFVVVEIQ
jgi:hypothetical protein